MTHHRLHTLNFIYEKQVWYITELFGNIYGGEMESSIKILFQETIKELTNKNKADSDDDTYSFILIQIKFLYDSLINNKNIKDELNGRELNYDIVASRNFSGPDEQVLYNIGEITAYISKI